MIFIHHPKCKPGSDCATGYSDYDSDCAAYDGYQRGLAEGRKLAMKEIAVNARFIAANQAANKSQAAQVYADALDDFADTVEHNIERADHLRPDIKDGEGET